jgi:electron transfer flavoprotein alpha subunit
MSDAHASIRRDPRSTTSRRPPEWATATSADIVRVDAPACHILAVPDLVARDLTSRDRELMAAARQLCGHLNAALVVALCLPPNAKVRSNLAAAGADRVVHLVDPVFAALDAEARVDAVIAAAQSIAARAILFPDTPQAGGELGRRVAARLGVWPAVGVTGLEGEIVTTREEGGAIERRCELPPVDILAPDAFPPAETSAPREARELLAPSFAAARRTFPVGMLAADPRAIALPEAELIVSAGNGVVDWGAFHALAHALGAAEAGSRVVCDAGHLSRTRQVGSSGTLVTARGYLALGISGASQHLEGIAACDRVVAVNTDAHAPIMSRADLAVVGDVQAIMPALLRHLEARGR